MQTLMDLPIHFKHLSCSVVPAEAPGPLQPIRSQALPQPVVVQHFSYRRGESLLVIRREQHGGGAHDFRQTGDVGADHRRSARQ